MRSVSERTHTLYAALIIMFRCSRRALRNGVES